MNVVTNVMRNLEQNSQYQVRKAAQTRAFANFASKYPAWAQYLFDEHFLSHAAAALIESDSLPDPIELANAWADQMVWPKPKTRQNQVADLIPAAAYFLQVLETEYMIAEGNLDRFPQIA